MTIRGELEAGAEDAGFAPWSNHSVSGLDHSRQLINVAYGILVKIHDLLRRFIVLHDGNVDGQHMLHVQAGLRGLQRDERLEKHAGAGEEHEGGGNLNHGENAETAVQRTRPSASRVRRKALVPAPSAARMVNSPSRRTVRARIRLAAFEQAMMNTRADAARSTRRMVRAPEVIWSRSSLV